MSLDHAPSQPSLRKRISQQVSQYLLRHAIRTSSLESGEAWDVLSNERRRQAIKVLDDVGGPITIGDLSELVAARENNIPVEQVGSEERKRAYVALYQSHLPDLEDAGLVTTTDDRRGQHEVEPTTDLSAVRQWIVTFDYHSGGRA